MYLIHSTKDYNRSYKKLKRSGLKETVFDDLDVVIDTLARGGILDEASRDHQLSGTLKEYRECHIKGDLLLIYQIQHSKLVLLLVDIGSHSYLFR